LKADVTRGRGFLGALQGATKSGYSSSFFVADVDIIEELNNKSVARVKKIEFEHDFTVRTTVKSCLNNFSGR